ncbi:hypothetical protein [Acinetobacter sp.]|uniref:hypothetical protein n=1 Tax=Acinetobacter sp. TaxID=472 RepID=UPI0035B05B0F
MSTAILVICGVMLIVAILVRIRQKKAEEEPQQKKTTKASATKTSKKTATVEAKPEKKVQVKAKKEAKRPQIDIDTLTAKIDVMIADRQFAKAEGMINQTLNQDASHHVLYSKLMNIYVLQHDEFAMNQLLNTVQNQRLNEVYQDLFSRKESYLEEKAALAARDPRKADVIEYTPSTNVAETPDFDVLNTHHNANATSSTNEPLTFNNPTSASSFDDLSFNVDSPKVEQADTSLNFDQSITESKPNDDSQSLVFNLDQDASAPKTESTPSFDFNLDQPSTEQPTTTNIDFNLNETTEQSESTSFEVTTNFDQTADIGFESEANPFDAETTFAEADDPITQAFPALAQVNPTALDIELAEQYIRLGEITAAKQLLTVDQTQLSVDQAEKVQQLLQKIA